MKNTKIYQKYNTLFGGKEWVIEHEPKEEIVSNTNIWLKVLMGIIIGFVNGFWGGGGGMICVPLLMRIIKLPEKKSHATTLLIMLPLSIASLIIYFTKGNLPIEESIKIGVGFVVGGVIGAGLLKVVSNLWLGILFSIIIIVGGIKLLI